MGVEAAMGQADLFHDVGDARAVVPASPDGARGGPDDPFVGDFLAAWGGPPGGGSAHMMSIIYQSDAERKSPTPWLIGGRGLRAPPQSLPEVMNGESCHRNGQPVDRRKVADLDLPPDNGRQANDGANHEAERHPRIGRRAERPWAFGHLPSQHEHRTDGKDQRGPL